MKYKNEVIINLPREKVSELFDSSENLKKWQKSLESFEHISGEPGRTGAKSLLIYDEGRRKVEMTETIIKRNLPDTFSAIYEAKGVKNWNYTHFHKEDDKTTRWIMDNEFQFSGFMKIMSLFFKKSMPIQTLNDMEAFKKFAENA